MCELAKAPTLTAAQKRDAVSLEEIQVNRAAGVQLEQMDVPGAQSVWFRVFVSGPPAEEYWTADLQQAEQFYDDAVELALGGPAPWFDGPEYEPDDDGI